MSNWTSNPLKIPDSAPEEVRQASTRWEQTESGHKEIEIRNISHALDPESMSIGSKIDNLQSPHALHSSGRQKLINNILENVFDRSRSVSQDPDSIVTSQDEPKQSLKRKRVEDASLNAALARLYPPKQLYNVKRAQITEGSQWQPTVPPTQDYDPAMRQPLDRKLRWNDHGLTTQTQGKVPHETVLDYLVDVMRNKHWRGTLTEPPSSIPTKSHSPWPRSHYSHISRIIASNPFLLRLAQMLEGRFYAASKRHLEAVPSVTVHGLANQNVGLEPHYIAAILIQTLGRENGIPCPLCAGDWNAPVSSSRIPLGWNICDEEIRPFQSCVSLYSITLPSRFAACANHFWYKSMTDCSCVNLETPIHPDERWEYIWETFNTNASNYDFVKAQLRDEWMQIVPTVPTVPAVPTASARPKRAQPITAQSSKPSINEIVGSEEEGDDSMETPQEGEEQERGEQEQEQGEGYISFGPFFVRHDIVRNPGLFAYGLDTLRALVEVQASRRRDVDCLDVDRDVDKGGSRSKEGMILREKLGRM